MIKPFLQRQDSAITEVMQSTTSLQHLSSSPLHPVVEFQAIILAGGTGVRLYPLTSSLPKCLLMVGNRPLLSFQLELLEKHGFQEVFVVTNTSMVDEVSKYVHQWYKGKMRILLKVMDDISTEIGTADIIRFLKDDIRTDFLILSADLVTDVSLHFLADIHRIHNSTITVLLTEKGKDHKDKDMGDDLDSCYIGLENSKSRIVYYRPSTFFEDEINIGKGLFQKERNVLLSNRYTDAYCYIFARWVLDLVCQNKRIIDIQAHLLPYLVSLQFQSLPDSIKSLIDHPQSLVNSMSRSSSSLFSYTSSSVLAYPNDIKCLTFIAPPSNFTLRCTNISNYKRLNKAILSGMISYYDLYEILSKEPFSHSIADPTLRLGEKCVIKNSVIGKHCRLGSRIRITNSILMDYIIIDDQVSIDNCIIGHDAHIQSQCQLLDAILGHGYQLGENSVIKHDTIIKSE